MEFFGEDTVATPRFDDKSDVGTQTDPFSLDIDDDILVRTIDDRIKASETFYESKKNLSARRKKLRDYMFGQQLDEKALKYYNARYIDNIPYESIGTIKPIALSRLPDMIVKPASQKEEAKTSASNLTRVVNSDIRKRENRQVLGLSFRHWPVYFIAAIKPIWDNEKDDYRFKVVHPENLVLDHTATTNDANDMSYVAETVEMTIKEAIMTFPDKEEELLMKCGLTADKRNEKSMATVIKLTEVWFKWPNKVGDKWETVSGVMWKFKDLLLKKMRNPYWDWEGKKRMYTMEAGKKRMPTDEEMRNMMFGESPEMGVEQYYYNYFSDPQFPYIFMGYDQWGEMPLDETSPIEQILPIQDNVNKRGRQITEMNDRAKGKHIFSTEGGIEKKTIEEMDMNNPDEDILVDGKVNEVHSFIPGQPAPAQLYKEQEQERQKAFAKMKTHSTTRGEKTSDVATTNQILREADFGAIDDMVNETINPAAEKMAAWAMQFIRLFYTVDHMKKILGADGQVTWTRINRDSVEDGMEVTISASGVDKIQRKREAFERARMKLTDPLSFYEDTDVPDPLARTEKLMMFMLAPELYLQTYVKKRTTQQMGEALNEQPIQGQAPPPPEPTPEGNGVAAGGGMTPHALWVSGYGGGSPTMHRG